MTAGPHPACPDTRTCTTTHVPARAEPTPLWAPNPSPPATRTLPRSRHAAVMTNKYSEGYPGARYYGGNEFIDQAERLCQVCACRRPDSATRAGAAPPQRRRAGSVRTRLPLSHAHAVLCCV